MSQQRSQQMHVPQDAIPARSHPDGGTTATCPVCGMVRDIGADGAPQEGHMLPVNCPCGLTFWAFMEHRRAYRRSVQLAGTYESPGKDRSEIAFINNLSMTGVGLNTAGRHGLASGDELTLRFTLDDGMDEEIRATVVVKHVRNNYLGCQFMNLADGDEERLAGYLAMIP